MEDEEEDDDEDEDDDDEIEIHPTKYFVKLTPGISEVEVEDLLNDLNSRELQSWPEIGLRLWEVQQFPYIAPQGIISNIDGHVSRSKTKTEINDTGFDIGYSVADLSSTANCFDAIPLEFPQGENSVKISIFDTGISPIQDNSSTTFNFNLTEYSGYDYINNDSIPDDLNGHGTHIAGLIHHIVTQASTNSSITFDIRKTHNSMGQGFLSDLVPAIMDAINEEADIINMSFSYKDFKTDTTFKPLQLVVDYAEQEGVLIVASAGNTNTNNDIQELVSFPSSFSNSNILSVASNDCQNNSSAFSSFGAQSVDVSILGEQIPGPDLGSGIVYKTGTSYSTAVVAALAAIIGTHQDDFDPQAVKCALINTSIAMPQMTNLNVANGIIDAQAAIAYVPHCMPANSELGRPNLISSNQIAELQEFKVAPNPFYEVLQLSILNAKVGTVSIIVYNEVGQVYLQQTTALDTGDNQIGITTNRNWPTGVYYLEIVTASESKTLKLIKY